MGEIGLWEMLMCILRMKMSAHLGKIHWHSLRTYQLLLVRPKLGGLKTYLTKKGKNKLKNVVWFIRKFGLVEMPMVILRMKKSVHAKKMHCHSHKRYQLLLITSYGCEFVHTFVMINDSLHILRNKVWNTSFSCFF
jgi:hypothetical protein